MPTVDIQIMETRFELVDFVILQVVNRDKKFVSATPLPGTIIVNIADLMQRWTADKFVSTVNKTK